MTDSVVVTELRYPAWQALQAAQSLGQTFPLLVLYDPAGHCIRYQTPSATFSAQDLDFLLPPQHPACSWAWHSPPWPELPPPATHTTRLIVLDVPFCIGCTHAEQVLREWVQDQPEQRRLHLVKVIPPSKAEMPAPATEPGASPP